MSELQEFLKLNNIKEEVLLSSLHLDIREIILKAVCDKMKKDQRFYSWAKRIYFSTDDFNATMKVVDRACKCKLSKDDIFWLQTCIKAFFSKCDYRRVFTPEEKAELLKRQDGRCSICGRVITVSNMHIDHIIPWDYVGDILIDNYQGLCKDCNLSKSNHVARAVNNLILHKGE